MVKDAEFLLLFRNPMTKATIPIAAEVAYCNESLELAMRESVMWKGKGNQTEATGLILQLLFRWP
jgi:hypothetical protein